MANTEFYTLNSYRAFPLQETPTRTVKLTGGLSFDINTIFVDALFILGPSIVYDYAAPITLTGVITDNDKVIFQFLVNTTTLEFTVPWSVLFGDIVESDNEPDDGTSAIITIGDLSGIQALGTLTASVVNSVYVEPSRVQTLYQTRVDTINLGNTPRVQAQGNCSSSSSIAMDAVIVNTEGLTGSLVMKPGYNCILVFDTKDNAITIGAAVNAGAGETCDLPDLWGDKLLLGCQKPVLSLGEATAGPVTRGLTLSGGPGVTITNLPDQHAIQIDVSGTAAQGCS